MNRCRFEFGLARVASALIFSLCAASAGAQYPAKPIKIVVPFPGGSATDTIARILAAPVATALGQAVIIENKPGADGAIAGADVAKAAPDGYTLLLAGNSPFSAVPVMKKNPPYDAIKDFSPITDIGRYSFFLFVNAAHPAQNLAGLVTHAKANPGKIAYATGNTTGIVSFEQIKALAGIDMLHVPYKGEPAAIIDLVGGRVQAIIATATTSIAHQREGKIRALAITSLPKRSALLPDVPTMAEAGMPKFSVLPWAGLFGPARMPPDVIDRLNREFVAAMKLPDVVAQMDKQAFFLTPSTPEALATLVKEQLDTYGRILRDAGYQPD
jgi:tripartite-type tricarboxylate transporter receptor subunit TctC